MSKNKVITQNTNCINNVITHNTPFSSQHINNNVITSYKNILTKLLHLKEYKVITSSLLCYSIVITSTICAAFQVQAIELRPPVAQGSLIYGRVQGGEKVFLNDKEILKNKRGEFVFGLPQDTADELVLTTKSNGVTKTWRIPIEKRKWKEEVVNGLPPHKVTPSVEDQERIKAENAALKHARGITGYEAIPFCFIRPVPDTARISSTFGARRILNGQKTAGHSGTDYAMPVGTPIVSPAKGIVRLTHDDMFYSGKTILVDHGFGVFSSYSHLNHINVKQGQHVNQGDLLGEIGTTGRSTGPHLHLTMTWFGVRVDPEFILQNYACTK